MPGEFGINFPVIQSAADKWGWIVHEMNSLQDVAAAQESLKPVAVYFHREAVCRGCSWSESLRRLRMVLPDSRLIACHTFKDPIDWSELSRAGAFHALRFPLRETEISQSLGFVWAAEQQRPVPIVSGTERARGVGAGGSNWQFGYSDTRAKVPGRTDCQVFGES